MLFDKTRYLNEEVNCTYPPLLELPALAYCRDESVTSVKQFVAQAPALVVWWKKLSFNICERPSLNKLII